MPKFTQKEKNEMWTRERKNLMGRVERLRAAGVSIKIDINRPEKITLSHIAALKSVSRSRLIKGVNNKVLTVETEIPETVTRNSKGNIVTTKEQLDEWRRTNREARERRKRAAQNASTINPYEIDYVEERAWREENERIKEKYQPDYAVEFEEEYHEPVKENSFHEIYTNDTYHEMKEISEKYNDDYSVFANIIANSKSMKEQMSPEMRSYINNMKEEKGAIAEKIEEELAEYLQAQQESDIDNVSYSNGTLYIDFENGKRYTVDSDGVVTEETIEPNAENFKYYRDKNTGTLYSQDDSRIYWRDSRGNLKRDNEGNPLIKPTLAEINGYPISKEDYDNLMLELLQSKYENLSTDAAEIVLDKYKEWEKKYTPEEIRYAEESAAADGYSITNADLYEDNEERLALKIRVIESYFPDKNYFDREKAIEDLAEYDDSEEDYEEPD